MPNGAASRGPTRGARRLAQAVTFTVGLQASQAEDQQSERERDREEMIEPEKSPLELPKKTYAAGGEEYQTQREKEAKMLEAGEQFVGAPIVPAAKAPPAAAEEAPEAAPERRRPSPPAAAAPEKISTAEAEKAQAMAYQAEAAKEAKRLQASAAQRAAVSQSAQVQSSRQKLKHLQNLYRFLSGASGVSLVGIILTFILLNVQLINHLSFKAYNIIPEPSVPEIGVTGCLDCVVFIGLLVQCMGCLIVASIIGIMAQVLS